MKAIFITPEESTCGFEPIVQLRSREMIETLKQMGVEVIPINVHEFGQLMRRNSNEIPKLGSSFIIAPNFNYFLRAAADNIKIIDSLNTQIVALWDDPLGALASLSNGQPRWLVRFLNRITGADPPKSVAKLMGRITERLDNKLINFRTVLEHPLMRHFSWDSGHIEAVRSLKLVTNDRVRWYPIATYAPFLKMGRRQKEIKKTRDVGFCGNLYLGPVRRSDFFKDEFLRGLTERICNQKLQSLNKPLWTLMMEEIGKLPDAVCAAYGLCPTRKPFWDYYVFVVWYAGNTLVRLGILDKVEREVSLYGLFADAESKNALTAHPNLKYEGMAHHFDDLPWVFASTKINICISNGLVYNGLPSKLIDCLASGGFALCDPKEDLLRFFGPTVEQIFFRNVEELNSKIEYYLARPHDRDNLVAELCAKIHQHCTLDGLFRQVIDCIKPQ